MAEVKGLASAIAWECTNEGLVDSTHASISDQAEVHETQPTIYSKQPISTYTTQIIPIHLKMKLAISTLALAAMAGSASATTVFIPPIPFKQYDGGCSEEVIYTGELLSIEMLEPGSFCISDNFYTDEGTIVSHSKVDVVSCEGDKIYEDWSECDPGCMNCQPAYQAYTLWEDTDANNQVGYCFDYFFSLDEVTPRSTQFTNVRQINFSFDETANPADVKTYVDMMDMNSCIKAGPPAVEVVEVAPVDTTVAQAESGASALAATAAVAMAAATTMLLA